MLLFSVTMRRPPRPFLGRFCKTCERVIFHPTIMLLMGMWMSFTKNPMNPIMANPIAVAVAIFWNSARPRTFLTLFVVHKISNKSLWAFFNHI